MARRDREEFRRRARDESLRAAEVERLRARRRDRGRAAVQFELWRPGGVESEVLHVPDELLAEPAAVKPRQAAEAVAAAGFGLEQVAALDGRVVRLHRDGASRDDLLALRAALRRHGRTSLSYVTPTRPVMKSIGVSTPEHPDEPRPQVPPRVGTPPGRPAPVLLVLDTGAGPVRDDGWLSSVIAGPQDADPLDALPECNGYLDYAAGHGTFVSGLVERTDPGLPLEVRRVVDSDGIDSELGVACRLLEAVTAALARTDRLLVNLSLGTETADDETPLALEAALHLVEERARDAGAEVLVVAAAGNDGCQRRCWPAAFTDRWSPHRAGRSSLAVVAVAALGQDGAGAPWSTRGPWVTCSTDGEAVLSTFVPGVEDPAFDRASPERFGGDPWAYWSGTSFSAPQVAARVGRAARLGGTSLREALAAVLDEGSPDAGDGFGVVLPPLW